MSKKIVILITLFTAIAAIFAIRTLQVSKTPDQQVPVTPNSTKAKPLDLTLITSVSLSGSASRFDYQSIDLKSNRLYISHMGADAVTVVDIKSQQVVADIKGIDRPTGVLVIPNISKVYVSASGAKQIVSIDTSTSTYPILHRISAGSFPDGIAYDPTSQRLFVSDESGKQVSVIDTRTDTLIGTVEIGGEVGNTRFDSVSGMIYSADQSNNTLVAINPSSLKIEQRIPLTNCSGPHGFYLDNATHYALITCQDSATFIALDLSTGKTIGTDTVGSSPDVLAFDTWLRRLYVASESGTLSIFEVQQGSVKKIAEGFLADHAHTVSVDSRTHRVFVPLESVKGKPVLHIYEPASVAAQKPSTGIDIEDEAGVTATLQNIISALSGENPAALGKFMRPESILVLTNGSPDQNVNSKEELLAWLTDHWSLRLRYVSKRYVSHFAYWEITIEGWKNIPTSTLYLRLKKYDTNGQPDPITGTWQIYAITY